MEEEREWIIVVPCTGTYTYSVKAKTLEEVLDKFRNDEAVYQDMETENDWSGNVQDLEICDPDDNWLDMLNYEDPRD